MTEPQEIRTPKSYWVAKRNSGHRNWRTAHCREVIQNAVDAGSSRIDITVEEGDSSPPWIREKTTARVVRFRVSDNGHGMDRDTIHNVFFSPGESTKSGSASSIGGFGTARIVTCFSQDSYNFRTGNLLVQGDGSKYLVYDVPGAVQKGVDFQIDIPVTENGVDTNSVDGMLSHLQDYLAMSQIAAKIVVNGEEFKQSTRKGTATRRLTAMFDGREQEFATVHANRGEKSPHKGKIIVRSNGAMMFVEEADIPFQVVVELDPSMARTVLMDNRDGMKWPYSRALSDFVSDISKDVRSALVKDDTRKHNIVRGGLGEMVAGVTKKLGAADWSLDSAIVVTAAGLVPANTLNYGNKADYEERGFGGVPAPVMDVLLELARSGQPTFIDGWASRSEVEAFLEDIARDGSDALKHINGSFAAFLVAGAGLVADKADESSVMSNSHDIHIYREGIVEGEKGSDEHRLFNAARRWSPAFWRKPDHEKGSRGSGAHVTLAVWTACCQSAVQYMTRLLPKSVPEDGIRFSTGFAFVKDQETWNYEENRQDTERVAALHKKIGDVHALLLNPVLNNGEPAYDLELEGGDPESPMLGLTDMMSTAWEKATGILKGGHDEEYSRLLTKMMAGFARQDVQRAMRDSMREAMNATRAAYGRGICRIQALEVPVPAPSVPSTFSAVPSPDASTAQTPGTATPANSNAAANSNDANNVRPAKRLLTLAYPATTMVLGTAASPDNIHAAEQEVPEILAYIDASIAKEKAQSKIPSPEQTETAKSSEIAEPDVAVEAEEAPTFSTETMAEPDGVEVITVDCDALAALEKNLASVLLPTPAAPVEAADTLAEPQPESEPESQSQAPMTVDLSSLAITQGAQTSQKSKSMPSLDPAPENVAPAQILAMLGQGQGRFSSAAKPVSQTVDVSSAKARIELANSGLSGLIKRGGFSGLANKIRAAAGDTSMLPTVVADPEITAEATTDAVVVDADENPPVTMPVPMNLLPHEDAEAEEHEDMVSPEKPNTILPVFGKPMVDVAAMHFEANDLVSEELDFLDDEEPVISAPHP